MIYFLLFTYEAVICSFYDRQQKNILYPIKAEKHWKILFLMILPLILVMGLRDGIGVDYGNYERIFLTIDSQQNVEIGYRILNRMAALVSDNPQIIFLLVSIIVNTGIVLNIIRYAGEAYCGVLAYMGLGYYFYAMNIQRQYIAVTILFIGYYYLIHRECKKFLVSILAASLFHTSALFMLVVYPILIIPGGVFYGATLAGAVFLHCTKNYLLALLSILGLYSRQMEGIPDFFATARPSIFNVTFSTTLLVVSAFLYPLLVKRRKENGVWFRLLWLMFLVYTILYNYGGALSRVAVYFFPVYPVLLTDVVNCFSRLSKKAIKAALFIILLLSMYVILTYKGNEGHHFLPYVYRLL